MCFRSLRDAAVVDSDRRLFPRSGRHRRHVWHVVARAAAERVHHGVPQPLPERLELELVVRRAEIEVGDLYGEVSLEGEPDEDPRTDGDYGEEAATDGNHDQRQRCLVMDLEAQSKM